MKYKIGERKEILIARQDANFDRAVDSAIAYARAIYGADSDGYLNNVEGHERSTDVIRIDLISYHCYLGMTGQSHGYYFESRVERSTE